MTTKTNFIKKFLDYFTTPKGIGLLIFLISLIVITLLLSSRYYLFQDIINDGISKKDIIASKTVQVIDKERTEKRKIEIAESVDPILRPAQDLINENMKKNLGETLNSIKTIRDSKDKKNIKFQRMVEILDLSDKDYFTDSSINYLIECSDKNFSKISYESLSSLDKILQKGVSDSDILNNLNFIISSNINRNLSSIQKQSISDILKKIITPNMIVDELATEIARKNAMNSVKPILIKYNKDEKIVSAGELVSKPQKEALKMLGYNVTELDFAGLLGIFFLVGICLYTMAYYILNFQPEFLTPSYLSLISLLALSVMSFSVFLPTYVPVYITPIPAVAILLTIFTNARLSLIATTLIVIMIGTSLQYSMEALTVFIIGGMIATYTSSMIKYYRRMDLVRTGFDVALIQVMVILSFYLLISQSGDVGVLNILTDVALGFISGIISGVIALGTLPLIESSFKIITPYGLSELADHNQTLLKRLQFEAPGTYHHSIMMANLAEAAAEAIGANPVLARVGAFYHDIGKLKRPLFFVENQSYFGIENPHEKLNPRLSKMVITAHPKDGLELAKEYKLPAIIHQFIIQHHGDGLAAYFYKQALEEEGAENISEEQFRYTCPKPSSKETAILMLADAVESAVRSLKNPTLSEIEEMIDRIIKERLIDGQLSESPLTQKDLKVIAATFSRILRGMQHHRIKYHENILEELGQKTGYGLQLNQTAKKIEKEFAKEMEKEKKEKKND